MDRVVEVSEFREGLHGGGYYFIVEGRRLIHISRYALKEEKYDTMVRYYVDLDKVKGRTVIEVMSSKGGGLFDHVWAFPAEDLPLEWDKRRRQYLPITAINDYELAHLGLSERQFLSEWEEYYRPMLNYIKREVFERGSTILLPTLVKSHVLNDLRYPASFLILYGEKARSKSLTGLTKEIHQAWVVIRILRGFTSGPLKLSFKQSSYYPIAVVCGYAMWYEFNLNLHTMFEGIAWRGVSREPSPEFLKIYERAEEVRKRLGLSRLPLRPDIAFTYAKSAEEFLKRPVIKMIVECKNFDYAFWKSDVEEQVKPYAEILKPEHMVIASLKPVPQYLKRELLRFGVNVIDGVYLGGPGESELVVYVRRALSCA
jgi:hypothetical protein